MKPTERHIDYSLSISQSGKDKKNLRVVFNREDIYHPTVLIGNYSVKGVIRIVDAYKPGHRQDGVGQSNNNDGSRTVTTKVVKLSFNLEHVENALNNQSIEFSIGEFSPLLGIASLGMLTVDVYKGEEQEKVRKDNLYYRDDKKGRLIINVDDTHQKVTIKRNPNKDDRSTVKWVVRSLKKEDKQFATASLKVESVNKESSQTITNDPFNINWDGFIYRHDKRYASKWKKIAESIRWRLRYGQEDYFHIIVEQTDELTQQRIITLLKDFPSESEEVNVGSNLLGKILYKYLRKPEDKRMVGFIKRKLIFGNSESDKHFIKDGLDYLFDVVRMSDLEFNDERFNFFLCDLILNLKDEDYRKIEPKIPQKLLEIVRQRMTELLSRERLIEQSLK